MTDTKATAKYLRVSPSKARRVVDLIRGKHVDEARRILTFSTVAAAGPVRKLLDSALANASQNPAVVPENLFVVRAYVDEGPTLRRWRPRALGRATRIRKRTCHVTLAVGTTKEAPVGPQG